MSSHSQHMKAARTCRIQFSAEGRIGTQLTSDQGAAVRRSLEMGSPCKCCEAELTHQRMRAAIFESGGIRRADYSTSWQPSFPHRHPIIFIEKTPVTLRCNDCVRPVCLIVTRTIVYDVAPRRNSIMMIETIALYHVLPMVLSSGGHRKRRYQPFRATPSIGRIIYGHHVDDEARTK